MTEEEFAEVHPESKRSCGRCPYCGAPGWIVGDLDWCEHYAGTYDYLNGSEPIGPFTEGEPFDKLIEVLSHFRELGKQRQADLLASLPSDVQEFLEKSLENYPEMFWLGYVRTRRLTVDISENLFDTTYASLFVKEPEKTRKRLQTLAAKVLSALQRCSAIEDIMPTDG